MDTLSPVVEAVRKSLSRTGAPREILIALSGGADSTALLLALCALREEQGLRLAAAHVDHGLREASREDAAFCRSLCERACVPLLVKRVRVSSEGSLEAAAREARYAALFEAMAETQSATLALAHHMDDQAETLLLHLLHGAGSAGLGGMREYRAPLWRPLLSLRREALRDALRGLGQPWREDETNRDTAFTRNLLRANAVPALEAASSQAVPALCRAAGILREEDDYLSGVADAFLRRSSARARWRFLMAAPTAALHPALQRRALRAYAEWSGLSLDFAQTEALRALLTAAPGGMENLPGGWRALRTAERLHLLPPESAPYHWPEASLAETPFTGDTGDGKRAQAFPEALRGGIVLRTKQDGDWIRPFGMRGRMKLKDYFSGRGVDRPFRADWPLVCRGHEVLWAIGLGASEALRLAGGQPAYMLTFTGDLPDAIREDENDD